MKGIKKAKRIANTKRGFVKWGLFIASFIPMAAVFTFLNLLLDSTNGFTYVKLLAILGVLVIFKYMWKLTKFLLNKAEAWYTHRYEVKDGEDDE